MKKKLLAITLVGAMAMSMAACGQKQEAAPAPAPEKEEAAEEASEASEEAAEEATEERTTFIVGFDAEYPPYGFMNDAGEYTGYDLDLAAEVCARNGWELVKQPIDWDSKDMELNGGTIDCIWNGFTMTGRESEYTWSVPYVDNSIVYVVAADSGIETEADLAGKIVETQADSSALAALVDEAGNKSEACATFGDLVQVPDYNTAFNDLASGACDAIAVDIGVAQYQLGNRDNVVMLAEPLSTEQYAIGFKLGNTELCETVQATLFEMYADGTFDKITANYADYDLPDMVCLGNYVK